MFGCKVKLFAVTSPVPVIPAVPPESLVLMVTVPVGELLDTAPLMLMGCAAVVSVTLPAVISDTVNGPVA